MKKFNGYEETKVFAGGSRLQKGGYVLRVLKAEEVIYSWGSVLKIDFDIEEGEYKGFYQNNYANQEQEDKKWKGSYRLPIPKDDGSEKDAWTKSGFKMTMQIFEKSNPGFKWDWDEKKLMGKLIGGLFNEKEWEINGNTGWYTQCKAFTDVERIRKGDYILPKNEPLKNKKQQADSDGFTNADTTQEELPF